jgi:hypothetical protein
VEVDIQELEHRVETLWQILEDTQVIMDEMSAYFMEQKDFESKKLVMQESNELEAECQKVIEKTQSACRQFEQRSVEQRWNFANEKQLCFRCLSKDHRCKDCLRSQPCKVNGCQLNHHRLLHRQPVTTPPSIPPFPPESSREGAASREGAGPNNKVEMMTQNHSSSREQCSIRTVPVWLKSNGKKVKVNAILDDASNESFVNEHVANLLGIQEGFKQDSCLRRLKLKVIKLKTGTKRRRNGLISYNVNLKGLRKMA